VNGGDEEKRKNLTADETMKDGNRGIDHRELMAKAWTEQDLAA